MIKILSAFTLFFILTNNALGQCVPPLVLTPSSTPTTCGLANGTANVLITDPVGTYTYAWSPGGGNTATVTNLTGGSYTVVVTDQGGCSQTASITVASSTAIALVPASTPSQCGTATGSASVVASGGTTPYTYAWSPSGGTAATAPNLTSGNYTVTVTDATGTCTATQTITVANSNAPVVNVDVTPASCTSNDNGTATVSATGGTGTYTYLWTQSGSNAVSQANLAAGTYTVIVMDGVCSIVKTFTITKEQNTLGMNTFTHAATCGGDNGSVIAIGLGGTNPYTFSWSPNVGSSQNVTGLPPGDYTVNVSDANSCTGSATVTVANIPVPIIQVLSVSNPTCFGAGDGSYVYSVNGTTPMNSSAIYSGGTHHDTIHINTNGTDVCHIPYTVDFVEPAQIIASPSITASACNAPTGSSSVSVTGGAGPYTYAWSTGSSSSGITGVSSGIYSVEVTDVNGCSITQTINIPTTTGPSLAVSATSSTCGNGTASVVATGGTAPYSYAWSPAGGTAASASALAAGTYTVAVTDANNCIVSEVVEVTPVHTLDILVAGHFVASCELNNGSIYPSVQGQGGSTVGNTYLWTPNGETGSSLTDLPSGNYSVYITDQNGCTGFMEVEIGLIPSQVTQLTNITNPSCHGGTDGGYTVSIIADGDEIINYYTISGLAAGAYSGGATGGTQGCSGTFTVTLVDPPQLVASISTIAGSCSVPASATVTASGGTGILSYSWSPSGGTGATASGLNPGIYTATVTDENGCSVQETVTVTSSSTLNLTSSTTPLSCGASNGTATVTATGGNVPYTYAWSPSGGTGATASNLPAGTYTVTVTDASSCTGTQTVTIAPSNPPVLSLSPVQPSCGSSNGSATVAVTGGVGPYTYAWSPSGGTGATASNLPAGTYTVTVTDANSCSANGSAVLTASSAVTAIITPTPATCGLSNGSATVTANGGATPYTYAWSPLGGTGATASNLPAGIYTLTVTDNNACSANQTVTIAVSSAVTATASATATSCISSTGTAAVTATGGTAPYTYAWSPSGGTGATAPNLSGGTYTVTVTDNTGCSATATATVAASSGLSVTVVPTQIACFGQANGSATATITGGTAPYTYEWSPSGGTGATASSLPAGTYTVTVTDNNGCSGTQTTAITQPASLAVNTSGTPAGCDGTPGAMNAVTAGGTGQITYLWQPGNLTGQSQSGVDAGNYTVVATDANGCTAAGSAVVGLSGSLDVEVDPLTSSIDAGDTVALNASDIPGATYTWSPAEGLSCTDCPDPLAAPVENTVYTVTITAPNGCTGTASAAIAMNIICTDHFIPTIFSPNGDGNNDEFKVLGNCITAIHVKVFDRWGEKVFETNDQLLGWNGTYKGQLMNSATFVYVVEMTFINGTDLLEKGNLTLMR